MSSCSSLKHALLDMQTMFVKRACRLVRMDTLQKRIQFAITASGKNIADVAQACGVSAQAAYAWVRGDIKNLRNEHLFALADLTGFEAKWIATGNGPDRPPYGKREKVNEVLRVMEQMPDYLIDKIAEDVKSLQRLADQIQHNGTDG